MSAKKINPEDQDPTHVYTVEVVEAFLKFVEVTEGQTSMLLSMARYAAHVVGPERLVEMLQAIAESDDPWLVVAAHNGNELVEVHH